MIDRDDLKITINYTMNHFNLSTIRYGALYLLISLSSNISSSLINSSSEYR